MSTPYSIALPPVPSGLWGLVLGFVARTIVAPALRYLADLADDYGDEDELPAQAPEKTERARIRLPVSRLKRKGRQ